MSVFWFNIVKRTDPLYNFSDFSGEYDLHAIGKLQATLDRSILILREHMANYIHAHLNFRD